LREVVLQGRTKKSSAPFSEERKRGTNAVWYIEGTLQNDAHDRGKTKLGFAPFDSVDMGEFETLESGGRSKAVENAS
jgi:hypothetical protein